MLRKRAEYQERMMISTDDSSPPLEPISKSPMTVIGSRSISLSANVCHRIARPHQAH